jgi:hypothetical protein
MICHTCTPNALWFSRSIKSEIFIVDEGAPDCLTLPDKTINSMPFPPL